MDLILSLKQELMLNLGVALLEVQSTEKILKHATTFFLPKSDATIDALFAEDKKERKRTLGFFIDKLKRRVNVTQDFEKELDSFVERRNTFAHDLHSVPGLDIGTKEGLEIGIEFVRDLREDARHIRDILRGLIRFIAEKAGLDVNSDPENYFNELISEVLALTVFNMNPE